MLVYLQQYSAGLRQYRSDKFGGFKIDKVKKEISRASRLVSTCILLSFEIMTTEL